jgi:hypothetical protein
VNMSFWAFSRDSLAVFCCLFISDPKGLSWMSWRREWDEIRSFRCSYAPLMHFMSPYSA